MWNQFSSLFDAGTRSKLGGRIVRNDFFFFFNVSSKCFSVQFYRRIFHRKNIFKQSEGILKCLIRVIISEISLI